MSPPRSKDSDAGAAAEGLAKQCGFVLPEGRHLQGNASISGVTSVDAFFSAVIGYQHTADSVSGEIETQLDAIKPDFGIAAGRRPQHDARRADKEVHLRRP